MRRSYRAAALTAVAFALASAASFTGPSFATEAEGTPSVSYIEHAASGLTAANLGLNDLTDTATPERPELNSEAPVAVHAMAPALPSPTAAPEERDGRSLNELVADLAGTETPDAEAECLARAVYYEARSEALVGQLTVAEVIINRAESGRFPSSICGVVRQRGQFSFVRGGVIPTPPESSRDWREAVAIAQIAMQDLAEGAAPRALFFHARRVNPRWRLTRVATVGNHVFYR